MAAGELRFNLRNIRLVENAPGELSNGEWQDVRGLLRTAFMHSLPVHRTRSNGLNNLVPMDNLEGFIANRLDPSRSFPKNCYKNIKVIRAFEKVDQGEKLRGYLSVADNTSGNMLLRNLKMVVPMDSNLPKISGKRYAHFRELAVDPEASHRGIATAMGFVALQGRYSKQLATAYTWPSELPRMSAALSDVTMWRTGTEPVHLYGSGQPAVGQERWIGVVASMREAILHQPGASQILDILS